MQIPWDRLGLTRLRAVVDQDVADFHCGVFCEAPTDSAEIREITFGSDTDADGSNALDVRELARVLHPTLADHALPSLCMHHGLSYRENAPASCLGDLFAVLVTESGRVDREVLALLTQLTEDPLSSFFAQILRLPSIPLVDSAVEGKAANEAAAEPVLEPASESTSESASEPENLSADEWLEADGLVARSLPAFERREGQIQMAKAVGEVFRDGGALAVEAGPGTGKTFAYLIPAIEHLGADSEARVVVSTRTKQLQEQLYEKDLPFLLARMSPELKVALLKGRENYLCLRRWEILIRELSEGLERDRLSLLAPLARWLWDTETGDIDENTAFLAQPGARELWGRLCDSHIHCVEPFCPVSEDCLSVKARRRARQADLAVVNHSLLLNDLGVARRVIGKYTHLVIDEGHALEESARSAFTATLAPRVVERLADELTPSRRRRVGFIRRLGSRPDDVQAASKLVAAMRSGATSAFAAIGRDLPDDRRGMMPALGKDSVERVDRLRDVVERLEMSIDGLVDEIEDPELKREGEGHIVAVREVADLLARLISPPDEETVRWYERDRSGLSIYFTPLEVAPILGRVLYPVLDALVLTSATLSVDGDFGFLLRTLGLDEAYEDARTEIVPSPFSYAESMRLCVPAAFPLPTEDVEAYADCLSSLLTGLARKLQRKGLVLFTSYRMLDAVRKRLPQDAPALAQGVDGPRSKIIERFRRHDGGMLLLGTDSFWEGVDLPGEELEYLVITRLPFTVPTDPVQIALARRLKDLGREPFVDLALPRAVLRLRQGVGRLIRTRRDRGAVILTDRRILTKAYGRAFVGSLPTVLQVSDSAKQLVDDVVAWIHKDA